MRLVVALLFSILLAACSSAAPPAAPQAPKTAESAPGCKLPLEKVKQVYAEQKWHLIKLTADQAKAVVSAVTDQMTVEEVYLDKDAKDDDGSPAYLLMFFNHGCAVAFVVLSPTFFEGLISGT